MRLLRLTNVLDKRGIKRAQHYADIKCGLYPPPVKLGRASAWPEYEIDELLQAQIAGADKSRRRALVLRLVAERKTLSAAIALRTGH